MALHGISVIVSLGFSYCFRDYSDIEDSDTLFDGKIDFHHRLCPLRAWGFRKVVQAYDLVSMTNNARSALEYGLKLYKQTSMHK